MIRIRVCVRADGSLPQMIRVRVWADGILIRVQQDCAQRVQPHMEPRLISLVLVSQSVPVPVPAHWFLFVENGSHRDFWVQPKK
jgi:hypothetical protein